MGGDRDKSAPWAASDPTNFMVWSEHVRIRKRTVAQQRSKSGNCVYVRTRVANFQKIQKAKLNYKKAGVMPEKRAINLSQRKGR